VSTTILDSVIQGIPDFVLLTCGFDGTQKIIQFIAGAQKIKPEVLRRLNRDETLLLCEDFHVCPRSGNLGVTMLWFFMDLNGLLPTFPLFSQR